MCIKYALFWVVMNVFYHTYYKEWFRDVKKISLDMVNPVVL
jgi:hypothetical protein